MIIMYCFLCKEDNFIKFCLKRVEQEFLCSRFLSGCHGNQLITYSGNIGWPIRFVLSGTLPRFGMFLSKLHKNEFYLPNLEKIWVLAKFWTNFHILGNIFLNINCKMIYLAVKGLTFEVDRVIEVRYNSGLTHFYISVTE